MVVLRGVWGSWDRRDEPSGSLVYDFAAGMVSGEFGRASAVANGYRVGNG